MLNLYTLKSGLGCTWPLQEPLEGMFPFQWNISIYFLSMTSLTFLGLLHLQTSQSLPLVTSNAI